MTIKERVLQYIDYKEVSKYKFYKEIGVANGFLDKPGAIGSDKCEIISSHYSDVNLTWLITGKGEMINSNKDTIAVRSNKGIPLIPTEAVAGLSAGDVSIKDADIQENYHIPDFVGVDFMIPVKGSSMYPKYNSGDVVACRMISESAFIQWNKVHIIATKEQGVLIKRLKKSENDNCLIAISDNPNYDPFEIPKDQILNLALVIGVIRLE